MSDAQRIQAQLKEAIELAQAGRRVAARQLLEDIIAVDPRQELAWLWLATVSTDREERIRFLTEVLTLNPDNTRAREAYAQLTGQEFVPPEPPPDALADEAASGGMSLSLLLLGAIILIGVMGVIFVLVVLAPGDNDEPERPAIPTRFRTATPTYGPSPTNTYTPFPTDTPGPSPTPIDWDALPTWTPEPTSTDAPTRTPLPSNTPRASRTSPPTRTPYATQTNTPPASDTPTPTETPDITATEMAEVALTSDAPATATHTPFPTATTDDAADEDGAEDGEGSS